ncbi:hypothetical protein EIP86_003039 [Pleurotus ostreatoroseus]|nr:hypothetical protein EIP86_003039 [Pleurotus ostreatoroseus]
MVASPKLCRDVTRKAYDLVRLALFHEQKRTPLKRDEISKKVLGTKSRQFNEVFSIAQETLRKTFGMEMSELQQPQEEHESAQKEAVKMGIKKKAAPTGTKTYILRSVLDPALIELAAQQDEDILVLEQDDDENAPNDDEETSPSTGAIFAWQYSDQLGSIGLLYVILALVLVNGKAILDNELRTLLKRLRLPAAGVIPLTNQSTQQNFNLDAFLTQCIRQGYLDRRQVGETKNAAKKRGRVQVGASRGENDDIVWEWRWGPRAGSEVGETDIANFVVEFMTKTAAREEYESEDAFKKARENTYKGIEKAAGGNLANIV